MDLTGVIENSLANAGLTDTDDAGDGAVDGGETPTTETGAVDSGAEAPEAVAKDAGAADGGDPAPPVDAVASGAPAVDPVASVPKKKQGPIPFDRHEKVLENARTAHATEKAALEARISAVSWAEHPEAQARNRAMGAADTHPELFAKALLSDEKLGPVFRQLLQAEAPPAAVPAPTGAPGARPGPDVVDAQGQPGYTEAGLEALLKWTANTAAAQAQAAFEAKYGSEIAPLVKKHKTEVEWNQDVALADRHIAEARADWAGFAEAEGDIKKYIDNVIAQKGRTTLYKAYQEVVVKKLKADRVKMREEIMAEMQGKAAVAQPRPAAASPAAVSGKKRDLTDVIHQSIAGLQ